MFNLNELDGKRYDENDPDQAYCLRKAKCYVDRTVDPPVIRVIQSRVDYEIVGWVVLSNHGELKSNGVDGVKLGEGGKYFEYHKNSSGGVGDSPTKKFPPGVYYLIRRKGREFLVSEKNLGAIK